MNSHEGRVRRQTLVGVEGVEEFAQLGDQMREKPVVSMFCCKAAPAASGGQVYQAREQTIQIGYKIRRRISQQKNVTTYLSYKTVDR